jgi:two-component system sensor histidine kinase TctE
MSLQPRGPRAVLHIADSGPGITVELRRRLFQPFSSGDPRSGSGLGLAICLEIVGSLGGEIRLDNRSELGRITGLDAVVSLPLADNPAA